MMAMFLVVGVSAPAVAQAPQAQWWDCGHKPPKGKALFMGICTSSYAVAHALATSRFSKKLYKDRFRAEVTCEPTHVACVEATD